MKLANTYLLKLFHMNPVDAIQSVYHSPPTNLHSLAHHPKHKTKPRNLNLQGPCTQRFHWELDEDYTIRRTKMPKSREVVNGETGGKEERTVSRNLRAEPNLAATVEADQHWLASARGGSPAAAGKENIL